MKPVTLSGKVLVWALASFCLVSPTSLFAQEAGELESLRQNLRLRKEIEDSRRNLVPPGRQSLPSVRQEVDPGQPDAGIPTAPSDLHIQGFVITAPPGFDASNLLNTLKNTYAGIPADLSTRSQIRDYLLRYCSDTGFICDVSLGGLIDGGLVPVDISFARLGSVTVEANSSPVRSDWIASVMEASVRPGSVLRLGKIDSAMLKINDLGGVKAELQYRKSGSSDEVDIILFAQERDRFQFNVDLNNETLPYMGPYQVSGDLIYESALGRGDYFVVDGGYSGNVNWYGSRSLGGDISMPLSPAGLGLAASYSWSDYRLLGSQFSSQSKGSADVFSLSFTQPLWRRPLNTIEVTVGGNYGVFDQSQVGIDPIQVDVPSGFLTLRGMHQDFSFGGVGLNTALLTLSAGSTNSDSEYIYNLLPYSATEAHSKGGWARVYGLLDRFQSFGDSPFSLELFAQGQWGSRDLYASEQFSLGWPNAVRAYPPAEASSDSGVSLQFTSRYEVNTLLSLRGFVDVGTAWPPAETELGNSISQPITLWGPGLGFDFGPRGNYLLAFDLAFPMGENRYRRTGLDADGDNPSARFWVSFKKWL